MVAEHGQPELEGDASEARFLATAPVDTGVRKVGLGPRLDTIPELLDPAVVAGARLGARKQERPCPARRLPDVLDVTGSDIVVGDGGQVLRGVAG